MLFSSNSESAAWVSLYLTNVYLSDANMDTARLECVSSGRPVSHTGQIRTEQDVENWKADGKWRAR